MLSVNPCLPTRRRKKGGKGRETYKLNIKPALLIRREIKHTKPIMSFPEFGAGCWHPTSSCQAAPGSPRLDSAVNGNWTQECTHRSLNQDRRQDKEQGPLQKAAMEEKSKTLVIPHL